MSRSIHSIARHFLNKDSLQDCSVEEIRELAESHPYASPIQFLLLEKLRTGDPQVFNKQVQKSILYYHDPLSFQYFLNPERFITEISEEENQTPGPNPQTQEIPPASAEVETIEEYRLEEEDPVVVDQHEVVSEPTVTEEETVEKKFIEVEPGVYSEVSGENSEKNIEEEETTPAEKENLIPELSIKPIKISKTEASDNDLVFDPYHTVDYFASQGIKLSQEEFSKDKFGKQLKSFTEWLKSMKRLPANETTVVVDSRTEDKVQHLAEDSIHQSEVYTEAMADVWLKQGNKAKAIEVYNKLSLINPSKKAYFATQIENLKQS